MCFTDKVLQGRRSLIQARQLLDDYVACVLNSNFPVATIASVVHDTESVFDGLWASWLRHENYHYAYSIVELGRRFAGQDNVPITMSLFESFENDRETEKLELDAQSFIGQWNSASSADEFKRRCGIGRFQTLTFGLAAARAIDHFSLIREQLECDDTWLHVMEPRWPLGA